MNKLPAIWQGKRRAEIVLLAANALIQSVSIIGLGYLTKLSFDYWITKTPLAAPQLAPYVIAFSLTALVLVYLRLSERVLAEKIGQDYVHELRGSLFDYISSIDDRDLKKSRTGAISLRFVGDLSAIRIWVSLGYARVVVTSFVLIVVLSALTVMQWQLGLVVFLTLITGLLISILLGRQLRSAVAIVRNRRARLASNINEKITSMATVRTMGAVKRERNRLLKQSGHLREAMIGRAGVIGLLRGVAEGSSQIAVGLSILVGGILAASGDTSPGTIVAALSIVGLLSSPIREMARCGEYWHNAEVARQKIGSYLSRYPSVTKNTATRGVRPGAGELTLRELILPNVTQAISENILPGRKVALTGSNGAGKSTLISVIAKSVQPSSGKILLDGRDITLIRESQFRKAVGVMGDRFPLLKGSILRNIRFRCPQIPEDEAVRCAELTGVSNLVAGTAKGLEAVVSEQGSNFSVGERARIELARAIFGSPKLLLLDEPDLGLDEVSLDRLCKLLREYQGTVIVATQNRRVMSVCDELWVLEDGQVIRKETPSPARTITPFEARKPSNSEL